MSGRFLLFARRIVIVAATLCLSYFVPNPVGALETLPGEPPLVDGPLKITRYSFQGDQLRFVEIYNDGNSVVDMTGWSLAVRLSANADPANIVELHGLIAPDSWVTAGNRHVFGQNSTTFSFEYGNPPTEPRLVGVMLRPPAGTYLEHEVTPSITGSTVRVDATPPIYGFQRNISTSTGNYTTTYSAVLPDESFKPFDDGLYKPPATSLLRIVEIYPNALVCSPLESFHSNPYCFDYVKVYNPTQNDIDLGEYRIRGGSSSASANLLVQPGHYAVLPINLNNSGWVWIEDRYGYVSYSDTLIEYPDSGSRRGQAWSWDGAKWRWSRYPTPYDTDNQFTDGSPVNPCNGLRLSEIGANLSRQFIEVYNSESHVINIRGCQLQTNRSQTAIYAFEDIDLEPGGYRTVYIDETDLTLTKTTSGTVYILSSDGEVEVDARSYENLSENSSYALIDGVWRQTFTLTPGDYNQYAEYPPCQEGYFRNTETGRCNKLTASAELADCGPGRERNPATNRCRAIQSGRQLTPCRPGQERNPATNRCRSIALASSTLTPCRPGQERNPATNRCRSVNSASTLKPCAPGQERNPLTNRCRKVNTASASDVAAFPVEPISEASRAFAAWWALGGVLILGAGYGAWEWRHEIANGWKRIVTWSKLSK